MRGYEYEYQPRVQLSLANYPMTNQRPCRAFSNNNAPLQAVLVCLSSNPPPCLFVIPRTDFVPRFLSVCRSNFISNQPDRYSPAKVCTSNIFVLQLHCVTSISFRLIFFSLVSKLTLARRVKRQITYPSMSQDRPSFFVICISSRLTPSQIEPIVSLSNYSSRESKLTDSRCAMTDSIFSIHSIHN